MRVSVIYILSLALCLFAGISAYAMAADDEQLAKLEKSYAELLEHPSNRQLNLNYAALAMEMKDYEAAISPLERIRMSEPSNAKICLQLGILYHLLGSDMIAREYFEEARALPTATPVIVEEAEGYLHGL